MDMLGSSLRKLSIFYASELAELEDLKATGKSTPDTFEMIVLAAVRGLLAYLESKIVLH